MGDVRDRMDEHGTPLCRWCGQYSTAQVCYRCTTDPLAGKVIDLERQLAEAQKYLAVSPVQVEELKAQLAEARADLRNALALLRYCFDGDDIPAIYTVEDLRKWIQEDSPSARKCRADWWTSDGEESDVKQRPDSAGG